MQTDRPPEYYYSEEYLMHLLSNIVLTGSMHGQEDFTVFVIKRMLRIKMDISDEIKALLVPFGMDIEMLRDEVNHETPN